ncbi:dihydroxyacetone kinase subunit DhaL [Vibrio sp. WXL103]|uniref:dihydroxyacetone kinase subunit DhaL n=1 Tax=Vibrio sp. WXL103 TaxID=3450710 RepID=UPI003EC4EDF8
MSEFTQSVLSNMLRDAAQRMAAKADYLNDLDGQTGDGDHGTTVLRVCRVIESCLSSEKQNWQMQIDDLGWQIMSQDGGSAGMLIGNFYVGLAQGLVEEHLSPSQVANTFRLALDKVQQFSHAKLGNKTMLDALIPAVIALEQSAQQGEGLTVMFSAAASAARRGADETELMRATRGRAKNLGEKSVGHLDPGAVSMAMMFESFALYFESNKE